MPSRAETGTSAAGAAREQARAILAEGRFRSPSIPRPLHGVLQAIGEALESPLNALDELVSRLAGHTPGGSATVWGALAALVLAASAALALRSARRSLRVADETYAAVGVERQMSAAELLRAAEAAESEGRDAEAVRLHFRRGLLLLMESERVSNAPAMLTTDVAMALNSAQFDALARTFDEIAYGGRAATEQDVDASRSGWSALLNSGGA